MNKNTKRIIGLQRGTEKLEAGPLPPDKRLIGPKEAAGIYDPGPSSPEQKEYAQALRENDSLMSELRKTVFGTIGVNINGQEMEVPLWNKDMTPVEAENAARDRLEMGLHPFTPEDQLIKAQDDEQARPVGYARGTDTVLAKLTPKEAVLNRNAAEIVGRNKIRDVNAMGNKLADKGVDLTKYAKYQYGTNNVSANQYGYGGYTSGNINPVASSYGVSPLSAPIPNLSSANPSTLGRLDISNLIYSAGAGGYLTAAEANNSNSYYNKFGSGGGGDPTANRQAAAYYNYIGGLPTQPLGTPALNQLYGLTGQSPAQGPSYNSILSNASQGSFGSGYANLFGNTYQGPFQFGQRLPGFNQFGSYKSSNDLSSLLNGSGN